MTVTKKDDRDVEDRMLGTRILISVFREFDPF